MHINSPLISLVIPFYNVEKFISQCLDSVYSQDIPEDNYEVICVNDASPDNSREIVLSFQRVHSNLILIDHEVNKNLGQARNTGRSVARGKYLWNIDSDDYIKPNCLKRLIEICEKNELDVLMFNHMFFKNDKEIDNFDYPFPNSSLVSGIDFLNMYCLDNFSQISPVWNQIYNVGFLNKNCIYSPEINMGEDVPFTLKALLLAQRVTSIMESCYVYRANVDSLGGTIERSPNAVKLYEKCFLCSKYVLDLVQFIPKKETGIIHAYTSISKYIISVFPLYTNNLSDVELKNFRKLCRKNFIPNFRIIRLLNKRNLFNYMFVHVIPIFKLNK